MRYFELTHISTSPQSRNRTSSVCARQAVVLRREPRLACPPPGIHCGMLQKTPRYHRGRERLALYAGDGVTDGVTNGRPVLLLSPAGVGCGMSDELARERNRRSRQRRREGLRSWELDLPDTATEQMIDALVYYGRLREDEIDDPDRVAAEIAKVGQALMLWWGRNWRELDHGAGIEILPIRVSRGASETE